MGLPTSGLKPENDEQKHVLEVLTKHKNNFHLDRATHGITVSCTIGDVAELTNAVKFLLPNVKPCTGYITTELPRAPGKPKKMEQPRRDMVLRWQEPSKGDFITFTEFLIANDVVDSKGFCAEIS